jgi:cell division protein ZapD
VLEPLLADIDRASAALLAQTGKAGVHLRDNEWLMTIKQRTAIPGGVCEFDLPATTTGCTAIRPRGRTTSTAGSSRSCRSTTARDHPAASCATTAARRARPRIAASSSLMLTTSKVAQLLRLTVPLDLPCVPEISANKYALNIRFIGVTGMDRGTVYDHDVEFELAFCNL